MYNPLDYNINSLNKLTPKKGRLLLAEPFMDDPYFKRSVVLLTEHNKDSAFGFILNKPLQLTLNETMPNFPKFDAPIYMGGPVQTDSLFYIHTQGKFIEGSLDIGNGLYWSGNFNQLKQLVKDQQIFPHEIKFFVGYSGWDFDQLNTEIKIDESWLITNLTFESVNDLNDVELWQNTLQKMGKKHSRLSNFPEDPSLN
jgi:putative transcriptional regulator